MITPTRAKYLGTNGLEWKCVHELKRSPQLLMITLRSPYKNTAAISMLQKNASRNKVMQNLSVMCADTIDIPSILKYKFRRAIIPTPYGMDQFLDILADVIRPESMIHFYTFKKQHQIEGLIEEYEKLGLKVLNCSRCGNVAAGVSRWVFDMIKMI